MSTGAYGFGYGGSSGDDDEEKEKGILWKLPEVKSKQLGKIGPALGVGFGCGVGLAIGIVGGTGVGPGIPGLQLGLGAGAGCGLGLGFGYGVGRGIAFDYNRRYSKVASKWPSRKSFLRDHNLKTRFGVCSAIRSSSHGWIACGLWFKMSYN